MKFLKLTTLYPIYMSQRYLSNMNLRNKSYSEQLSSFQNDYTTWANYWEQGLSKIGYECTEILANVKELQHTWAEEREVLFDREKWFLEIARAQIIYYKPEILFIQSFASFPEAWIKEIKQECSSIKLTIGWCSAPYKSFTELKAYDIVLSCIPELSSFFNKNGIKSYHLNHAFSSAVLANLKNENHHHKDVIFSGSIIRKSNHHLAREQFLLNLSRQVPLHIYSAGAMTTFSMELSLKLKQSAYYGGEFIKLLGLAHLFEKRSPEIKKILGWKEFPLSPVNSKLKKIMEPPVFGMDMFNLFHNSKFIVNMHTSISPLSASNVRLFEATGVGACLVTDWKENLQELFKLDEEVVTYKSLEECVEKINWLIRNPIERERIAMAGQNRTLSDHNIIERAKSFNEIIKREIE